MPVLSLGLAEAGGPVCKAAQASLKKDHEQDLQKTVFYCFHSSMQIISQHSKQQSGMLHKESIGAFYTVWPSHLSQVSEQAVAGTGGDCGCIWISHSLPCAICSSLLVQVPCRGQQRSRIPIRLVWYLSSFMAISLAFRWSNIFFTFNSLTCGAQLTITRHLFSHGTRWCWRGTPFFFFAGWILSRKVLAVQPAESSLFRVPWYLRVICIWAAVVLLFLQHHLHAPVPFVVWTHAFGWWAGTRSSSAWEIMTFLMKLAFGLLDCLSMELHYNHS